LTFIHERFDEIQTVIKISISNLIDTPQHAYLSSTSEKINLIYARKIEKYWMNCTHGDISAERRWSQCEYYGELCWLSPNKNYDNSALYVRFSQLYTSLLCVMMTPPESSTLSTQFLSLPLAVILPLWCKFWRSHLRRLFQCLSWQYQCGLHHCASSSSSVTRFAIWRSSCELSNWNGKGDENQSIFNWIKFFLFLHCLFIHFIINWAPARCSCHIN
jgi:hypothetical protein